MKFRKKPVVIEAVQWDGKNTRDIVTFTGFGLTTEDDCPVLGGERSCLIIPTLEGRHHAAVGDWVIRGVKGEFYPCKPDIFTATYEDARAPDPRDAELSALRDRLAAAEREMDEALADEANTANTVKGLAAGLRLNCARCAKPATCVGEYEGHGGFEPACDECCGHGCEDGICVALRNPRAEAAERRAADLAAALEPFAKAWREYDGICDERSWTQDTGMRVFLLDRSDAPEVSVRFHDFFEAARALAAYRSPAPAAPPQDKKEKPNG